MLNLVGAMRRFSAANAWTVLSLMVIGCLALGWAAPAQAQDAPGQAAETLRSLLVQAQLAMSDDPAAAGEMVQTAAVLYQDALAPTLSAAAPQAAQRAAAGLAEAAEAAAASDPIHLAAARAQVWTALLDGAMSVVQEAIATGRGDQAQSWLLVREFRQATRFSRPSADAAVVVAGFAGGQIEAGAAMQAVQADLLDTYQTRLNQALDAAAVAQGQGFGARSAEAATLAEGYFALLIPALVEQRGPEQAEAATRSFAELRAAAVAGQPLDAPLAQVRAALQGFRAAPLSPTEQTRRAGQMLRFLSLVPVEYGRGVRNGQVAIDLEIREAITFADGAAAAFADLEPQLASAQPAQAADAAARFAALQRDLAAAGAGGAVADPAAVRRQANELTAILREVMPDSWQRPDSNADFDVIGAALDQMERAVAAGEYTLAESARLEAYAILESGPEAKLVAFAPQHVTPIEELFWYGQGEQPGLAFLIKHGASRSEIAATRQALDARLAAASEAIGGDSAPAVVATNAAIIVFREGLEAVVILAALMASMVGAKRIYRRPMAAGVLLALLATAVTFWLAQQVLTSFSRYGEKLEAVVSLVAIGVLLLITNWFFHQVYWKDHLANFHAQKKALLGSVGAGQLLGFVLLGFSSVYREGFETVLFLQALVLESSLWTVVEGVAIGILAVLAVGVITFKFQSRLPYKKMLVWTGVLIGAVLLMMVGNTVHAMQVVGWLPTHPIRWLTLPYWTGMWFGLYPTWEGITAQLAALVFVLGSYFLAERQRGGRRKKDARPSREKAPAAQAPPTPHALPAESPATAELAVQRALD